MSHTRFLVSGVEGEVCWYQNSLTAYITWIEVNDPGKGHGTKLLKAFEEYAMDTGLQKIECINVVSRQETSDTVLRRLNFFQKNGYMFEGLEHLDLPTEGPIVHFKRSKRLDRLV
jgi:GNAT superfamily N-acetyltransferase